MGIKFALLLYFALVLALGVLGTLQATGEVVELDDYNFD
jgi:hypothetical protein